VIVCIALQTITFFITTLIVEAFVFCYAGFMSETQYRTILYGNSLILEGVRVELSRNPGVEVIMLNPPLNDPLGELQALKPAAIIFDLDADQTNLPLALLQQPDLLLIGIDPETHQAQVWSGRQVSATSAEDLKAMMQKKIYGKMRRQGDL
jgi:hypothetical protein